MAQARAGLSSVDRVETWLVNAPELNQALELHAPSLHPQPDPGNHPLWVVASFGSFFDGSQGAPPDATAHLSVAVYDAETGQLTVTTESASTAVPAWVAALTDHSTRAPCPSPSATSP